jgi:hypothetical protein
VDVIPEEASNFVQDVDGQWVYVGDSILSLIAALNANT